MKLNGKLDARNFQFEIILKTIFIFLLVALSDTRPLYASHF